MATKETMAAQFYAQRGRNCGNCKHYRCDKVTEPPAFSWADPRVIEQNKRCAIGGFAVKKTAVCNLWSESKVD